MVQRTFYCKKKPLDPKTMKEINVLSFNPPKNMGYNPESAGCGFPWPLLCIISITSKCLVVGPSCCNTFGSTLAQTSSRVLPHRVSLDVRLVRRWSRGLLSLDIPIPIDKVFGAWLWGPSTSSRGIWMARACLCVNYSKVTRRHPREHLKKTCGSLGV